jgi:hypothetical protein
MTMAKARASRHRVPLLQMKSDPITPEYQAEVDQSMARLEARYLRAEKALAAAELKAERARIHAENLARKQAEADAVAANRLENERQLSTFIEQIREAAKNSRLTSARAKLERQHSEAVAKRNVETARRKAEAKATRERRELIAKSRNAIQTLESETAERRRELREIQRLMMPGNYAGRVHRGTAARHTHGGAA